MAKKAPTEKKPQIPAPELKHLRSPTYMEAYATGAFGGFDSQGGFHIIFYSPDRKLDTLGKETQSVVEISHKVKVIMTPTTLKQMASWLNRSIIEYEAKFGKVSEPPVINSKIVGIHPPETMYG